MVSQTALCLNVQPAFCKLIRLAVFMFLRLYPFRDLVISCVNVEDASENSGMSSFIHPAVCYCIRP